MANKRDIQGRVQGVNDNGVNIDGTWYNYSRFFEGEKSPARGASVTAVIGEFKGKDYLNKLTVIGTALPNSGTPGGTSNGTAFYGGGRGPDTDRRIARQVALKAAIENGPGRDPAEQIAEARKFEQYLNEPFVEANVEDAA